MTRPVGNGPEDPREPVSAGEGGSAESRGVRIARAMRRGGTVGGTVPAGACQSHAESGIAHRRRNGPEDPRVPVSAGVGRLCGVTRSQDSAMAMRRGGTVGGTEPSSPCRVTQSQELMVPATRNVGETAWRTLGSRFRPGRAALRSHAESGLRGRCAGVERSEERCLERPVDVQQRAISAGAQDDAGDFGRRPEPHWWSPATRSAADVELRSSDAVQPGRPRLRQAHEPGERPDLAAVRVAGKLQPDVPGAVLGDLPGRLGQQDHFALRAISRRVSRQDQGAAPLPNELPLPSGTPARLKSLPFSSIETRSFRSTRKPSARYSSSHR